VDGLGVRVRARVARVQRVDVGQEEEPLRVDHASDEGRQGVVVAEADLLRGADGVVLVDDGEDVDVEELLERAACVEVVRSLTLGY